MNTKKNSNAGSDYARVARVISFLEKNFTHQPDLHTLSRQLDLSPHHFHRLFHRWAGVTPKQFIEVLTAEYAKKTLRQSATVLHTTHTVGLSGSGRLHDLFVNVVAMTPGEYRREGAGQTIEYGHRLTAFGQCWVGVTDRGVCALEFDDSPQAEKNFLRRLKAEWPKAEMKNNSSKTETILRQIFERTHSSAPTSLLLKGTPFQLKVWQALLNIPESTVCTYESLAASLQYPRATRAVASAVARNPIAWLIPCHRVIRKTGVIGQYRWGQERKKVILGWEFCQSLAKTTPQ